MLCTLLTPIGKKSPLGLDFFHITLSKNTNANCDGEEVKPVLLCSGSGDMCIAAQQPIPREALG